MTDLRARLDDAIKAARGGDGVSDECARCPVPGACCRFLLLPLAMRFTADDAAWIALHPGVSYVERAGIPFVKIATPCAELDPAGRCKLHGSPERPSICDRWPTPGDVTFWADVRMPDADHDRCTYLEDARGSATMGADG